MTRSASCASVSGGGTEEEETALHMTHWKTEQGTVKNMAPGMAETVSVTAFQTTARTDAGTDTCTGTLSGMEAAMKKTDGFRLKLGYYCTDEQASGRGSLVGGFLSSGDGNGAGNLFSSTGEGEGAGYIGALDGDGTGDHSLIGHGYGDLETGDGESNAD